jgi:hypothetical protein
MKKLLLAAAVILAITACTPKVNTSQETATTEPMATIEETTEPTPEITATPALATKSATPKASGSGMLKTTTPKASASGMVKTASPKVSATPEEQ